MQFDQVHPLFLTTLKSSRYTAHSQGLAASCPLFFITYHIQCLFSIYTNVYESMHRSQIDILGPPILIKSDFLFMDTMNCQQILSNVGGRGISLPHPRTDEQPELLQLLCRQPSCFEFMSAVVLAQKADSFLLIHTDSRLLQYFRPNSHKDA